MSSLSSVDRSCVCPLSFHQFICHDVPVAIAIAFQSPFNIYIVTLALTEDEMLLEVFEKEMVKTLLRENERIQRESAEEMSTQILSRCV